MQFELCHIRHILALADERHFARAAHKVHLSQPAFSRSIQAIESALAMKLFERAHGAIRPTPAGEFVIARARQLDMDARSLQRDIDLYRDSQLGSTAFGVGPYPAASLMPRVLTRLRQTFPDIDLRVEVNNWRQLLERLQREDIEFFFSDVSALPHDPTLSVALLGQQRAAFYVRAGHPLAIRERCSLREVWPYGVAAAKVPLSVKELLAEVLGLPSGQQPSFALECDDTYILRAVALATDTVFAAPEMAAQSDVESGNLVQLAIDDLPNLLSRLGVVRLKNRMLSPMAEQVIEQIKRIGRDPLVV
ncbi:MAG: LysR family transcriptional regulator [Sphingomonadales bacterium]